MRSDDVVSAGHTSRLALTGRIAVIAFLYGAVATLQFTDGDRPGPHLPPAGPLLIACAAGLVLALGFTALAVAAGRQTTGRLAVGALGAGIAQVADRGELPPGADEAAWLRILRRQLDMSWLRWVYVAVAGFLVVTVIATIARGHSGFYTVVGQALTALVFVGLAASLLWREKRYGPGLRRVLFELEAKLG